MTSDLKIAVYAISKNEEQFVERFCKSCSDADLIIIADTGSTDSTVSKSIENGAVVHHISISPWRFDKARDAALALVPKDVDICVSLDLDEVLEDGWRQEIERVWVKGKTTRLRYTYDWGQGVRFQYEKIHARHGYHWHHPCHEYPRPDARITETYAQTDMLLVSHYPDATKSRGQYLDLLELSIKEDPHCPRNAFYYARELTFWSKWQDAIIQLNKYLEMPEAVWANERSYAMRLLGKSYDHLGQSDEALKWFRRAIAEDSSVRDTWCDLALSCYSKKMWNECYAAAESALKIKHRQLIYTIDPSTWGALPHDLASISAWNLGFKEKAIEHAQEAVLHSPTDLRLINNLNVMRKELEKL